MHRYTYTKDGQADIVINLGGLAGPMKMRNGRITTVSNTQLEGYYDRTDGTWGGPAAVRVFFVIQFETAFSNFTTYDDPQHNSTSAFVTHDKVSAGDVVQMKAALSFASIAGARANLAAELDHWDFDAVLDESFRIWNTWLGRIDVEGGTDAQRTKFYTDLWHVLLGRHVLNDVDGAYPDYAGSMAVDGIKGIHMANEWSSAGEATPWIQLDWPAAVTIRGVRLFDRPKPDDHTQRGTLTFSDGSSIDVADIADDGSMKTIVFDAKAVTWIRFQVTGGSGSNRGLSEIEVLSDTVLRAHSSPLLTAPR